MAVAIAVACLAERLPPKPLAGIMALGLCAGLWQAVISHKFAQTLIQPVDIAQTVQFKTTDWLDRNLPGQRTMISGDVEFLNNVLFDNPQMSGGHEPTLPNLVQRFAIFEIYTGTNAGDRDAEYSLIWLKAFGNQAVTVPGEKSREAYHPFVHPHKFDGLLPVAWRAEDDTIFAIPQASRSLARVIPKDAVVARVPIHGLDVDPVRPYVAALDDARAPLATVAWESPSHIRIRTEMKGSQALSVQENYAPGWKASAQGCEIPVRKDGLGLMVIDPGCNGPCEVALHFGVSREAWLCRVFSLLTTVFLICAAIKVNGGGIRRRRG